jgi:hypothetical protein
VLQDASIKNEEAPLSRVDASELLVKEVSQRIGELVGKVHSLSTQNDILPLSLTDLCTPDDEETFTNTGKVELQEESYDSFVHGSDNSNKLKPSNSSESTNSDYETDSDFEENNLILLERSALFRQKCQAGVCCHGDLSEIPDNPVMSSVITISRASESISVEDESCYTSKREVPENISQSDEPKTGDSSTNGEDKTEFGQKETVSEATKNSLEDVLGKSTPFLTDRTVSGDWTCVDLEA